MISLEKRHSSMQRRLQEQQIFVNKIAGLDEEESELSEEIENEIDKYLLSESPKQPSPINRRKDESLPRKTRNNFFNIRLTEKRESHAK